MNKQKLIGLIIGILLFIGVIAGLTYAYISWTSESVNKVVSSKCFNVLYDKGSDISGNIKPSADYTGGISATVKMDMDSSCNINAKGKIYITTNDTTSENLYTEGILNYQVLIDGIETDLKGTITSSGVIALDVDFLNSNTEAITTYTVYIWVNGEYVTNEHITSSYSGSIKSEAVQTTEERPTYNLLEYINSLYVNGNPTLITQEESNDSYYYSYQDDTNTWGLMNDGLKVSETYGAGATTITDEAILKSGTEGNIRYFGPSASVNNYIYFNCESYPKTNCELWRIIGIVDGKVKIIRNESIGQYSWDNKSEITGALTNYGSNDWSDARLMRLLNPGYDDYIDKDKSGNDFVANNSLYWNSGNGNCYDVSNNSIKQCNFTSTGIKNDTTRNMILESTWYLGGFSTTFVYPNDIYNYERINGIGTTIYGNNPYTVSTMVGLMYMSDYAYGTNLTKCSKELFYYSGNTDFYECGVNNWLKKEVKSYWSITPYSNNSDSALVMEPTSIAIGKAYSSNYVTPVLYLNEELKILLVGDGSFSNPYRISVN